MVTLLDVAELPSGDPLVPPDALGPQPALGHPFLAEPTAAWSCRAAWVSPAGRHWKPPLPGARSGRSGARAGGGFPPGRRAVFRWSLRSAPTCDDARIWASRPATSSSRSLRGEVTSSCRGCTFLSSSTLTSAAASTSLRSAPVAASVTLRSHASLSRGTSSSRCPSLLGTQHLEGGARLTDPAARSPGWARASPDLRPGFLALLPQGAHLLDVAGQAVLQPLQRLISILSFSHESQNLRIP